MEQTAAESAHRPVCEVAGTERRASRRSALPAANGRFSFPPALAVNQNAARGIPARKATPRVMRQERKGEDRRTDIMLFRLWMLAFVTSSHICTTRGWAPARMPGAQAEGFGVMNHAGANLIHTVWHPLRCRIGGRARWKSHESGRSMCDEGREPD
jgi:hypothetical protein